MKIYYYLESVYILKDQKKHYFIIIETIEGNQFITNGDKLKKYTLNIQNCSKRTSFNPILNDIINKLFINFEIKVDNVAIKKYMDYNLTWSEIKDLPIFDTWYNSKSCSLLDSELVKQIFIFRIYYNSDEPKIEEVQIFSLKGNTPNVSYNRLSLGMVINHLKDKNLNYYYNLKNKTVIEVINTPLCLVSPKKDHIFSIRYNNNYYLPHIHKNKKTNIIEIDKFYVRIDNKIFINDKYNNKTEYLQYIIDIDKKKYYKKMSLVEGEKEIKIESGIIDRLKLIKERMIKFSEIYYKSEIDIINKILKEK